MKFKSCAILMASTALTVVSPPSFAQTLDALIPSPNLNVAPLYPASTPNSATPIPSIQEVTGFGRTFGFGSSSTNTRRALPGVTSSPAPTDYFTEVNSNGHAIYIELFSPLIGAQNGRGNTFPTATNLADGGSNSVTVLTGSPTGCTVNINCVLQPEIKQFQQAYGRYNANDIVVQFSGINDFSAANTATNAAVTAATVAQNVSNQTEAVRENIALGARTVVYLNLPDLGTFNFFNRAGSNNDSTQLTLGSAATNAGARANLVALQQSTGVNIHYFDTDMLVREMRANPISYGFSVAGVQPNASCLSLADIFNLGSSNTACRAGTFAQQNQFISLDGIHYTYRFHAILGEAIANQLLAPFTVAPQAEIAGSTSSAFSSDLLLRMDSYRLQTQAQGSGAPAAKPFSVFVEGDYNNANRDSRHGGAGYDNDPGSLTVGGEYRVNPNLMVGAAFNYASPGTHLTSLGDTGDTRISVNAYQIGAFASYNRANWYVDGVFGYGFDNYDTKRAGIVDQLTSSHSGNTLFAGTKGAYLVDFNGFQVGPLGSLVYNKVWVDKYSERGDPLLTQSVGSQDTDSLVGGLGVQLRHPFSVAGRVISPFLNLTAEHEFLNGSRTLATAQTYSLDLPISTTLRSNAGRTYGKVAAGASFDVGYGLSVMVNGSSTFARNNGDDYLLNGGIKYSF